MLNRYVAAGMVAEAHEGRRILVLSIHGRDARASMDECLHHADEADLLRVTRANGAERITFNSGGRIIFRSVQGHGHRGVSVDTVYADTGEIIRA
ncbi:hypothetical protein [Microbacterium sp. NPDC056052]|uniref:hypothetical protein n=1 Tax=Microbacterium sp. NPDC056052 TaxID=3345695 RepID=UPI0035E2BDD2